MKNILRSAGLLLVSQSLWAHVGSPDIFYDGEAGPYALTVAVRPPSSIPGMAEIELRALSPDVSQIRIVPMPLMGPGRTIAPVPDLAQRSEEDPQFFTDNFWMMTLGSWQVKITVSGARGIGHLSVPVPAIATGITTMSRSLGVGLFVMIFLLAFGWVAIVGAAVREGTLAEGLDPTPAQRRTSVSAMIVTAALMAFVMESGRRSWDSEASMYQRILYKPLPATAFLEKGQIVLRLQNPEGRPYDRRLDDFIPDHNHLMHLFVIREPDMDRLWHLHPSQQSIGIFAVPLPRMTAGRYRLFADVVHGTGISETMVTEIQLPNAPGRPLTGDDSAGLAEAFTQADFNRTVAPLSQGGRMIWERDSKPLLSQRLTWFRFRVEGKDGNPAQDLEPYMGMAGHAVFVRSDFSVFAHIHPSGSIPMAALGLVPQDSGSLLAPMTGMGHSMALMEKKGLSPEVRFPYGFPKPGDYRIFVQIRRRGRVETGVFDARVTK